ncbi:sulfatase-like hydrolase/transferase [Paenibacillus arenilitoris]|uniref:Sulfatase-like hydrolase/transferase n=1 Tax=Paenibacillus arenilitoris TaxID=2772299 RepID=A0A927CFS9_9BACL|nr:sulfatase-like hydrolase/transferase [Paenibacillus arenilitoris]MBD2867283.1 sulfatase-like hydrolase/transferase [Paenibacillus arenilitoris]
MKRAPYNVLLITADQLRHDCVGYAKGYPVRTPNLDRLAAQGTAFSHAYSVLPVCGPARQSLLHGRRPETFGALWNYDGALPVAALQPDAYTWTQTLARSGYASAYFGKWGVNPVHDATAFGYREVVGEAEYRRFAAERYPDVRFANGYFGETNPIPVEDADTHWFAARAVETMEKLQEAGGPWHIALHFAAPHLPSRPSGRFATMYDPSEVPEWAGFRETFEGKPYIQRQQLLSWGVERFDWDDWAQIVARYYGVVSQMDDAVGRVLDALARLGAADDTLVIFTSDHGDLCGSHRMMDKHYVMYDDVVRVPLVVRLPAAAGRCPRGVASDAFVYNFLDLPPTLLELLGLHSCDPGNLQGRSLLPLLADGAAPEDWRDAVVSSYNGQQFGLYTQRMIRESRWKYVWNTTDIDELYDLQEDPAELVNRIGSPDLAATLAELRLRLHGQLTADGDPLAGNEWTRRQLLGNAKLSGDDGQAGRG